MENMLIGISANSLNNICTIPIREDSIEEYHLLAFRSCHFSFVLNELHYRAFAFIPKSCEGQVPSGWDHWGGFINTYDFYNASMYDVERGDDRGIKVMTGVHQGDFLGNMTLESAEVAIKVTLLRFFKLAYHLLLRH